MNSEKIILDYSEMGDIFSSNIEHRFLEKRTRSIVVKSRYFSNNLINISKLPTEEKILAQKILIAFLIGSFAKFEKKRDLRKFLFNRKNIILDSILNDENVKNKLDYCLRIDKKKSYRNVLEMKYESVYIARVFRHPNNLDDGFLESLDKLPRDVYNEERLYLSLSTSYRKTIVNDWPFLQIDFNSFMNLERKFHEKYFKPTEDLPSVFINNNVIEYGNGCVL